MKNRHHKVEVMRHWELWKVFNRTDIWSGYKLNNVVEKQNKKTTEF